MTAYLGHGTLLQKDVGVDNWVTVAQCKTITGPSYEADELDVTTHDSAVGFREFIRGLIDPGEVGADIVFDPADDTHTGANGIIDDLQAGVIRDWRIQWPIPAKELLFSSFVKSFPITSPVDAELTATVALRVSGDITLADI